MAVKSVRLSVDMWREINQQTARLNLRKESELVRMVVALGLAQLKEKV